MIRIMTADEPQCITITVDGKLSDHGVEPVEASCVEALLQGKPVRLYLRDVSAIDERGRTMLRRVAAKGINLSANGIYSAYIVHEIQSAGK
jgi:hypothetical protein